MYNSSLNVNCQNRRRECRPKTFGEVHDNYNWIECASGKNPGKTYFYNVRSHCTTWTRPIPEHVDLPFFNPYAVPPEKSDNEYESSPLVSSLDEEDNQDDQYNEENEAEQNFFEIASRIYYHGSRNARRTRRTLADIPEEDFESCETIPIVDFLELVYSSEGSEKRLRSPSSSSAGSNQESFEESRKESSDESCQCSVCLAGNEDSRDVACSHESSTSYQSAASFFSAPRLKPVTFADLVTEPRKKLRRRRKKRKIDFPKKRKKGQLTPDKRIYDMYGVRTINYDPIFEFINPIIPMGEKPSCLTDSSINSPISDKTTFEDIRIRIREPVLSESSSGSDTDESVEKPSYSKNADPKSYKDILGPKELYIKLTRIDVNKYFKEKTTENAKKETEKVNSEIKGIEDHFGVSFEDYSVDDNSTDETYSPEENSKVSTSADEKMEQNSQTTRESKISIDLSKDQWFIVNHSQPTKIRLRKVKNVNSTATSDENISAIENNIENSTINFNEGKTQEDSLKEKSLQNSTPDYTNLLVAIEKQAPQNFMAENNAEDLSTNSEGGKSQEESSQKKEKDSDTSTSDSHDSSESFQKKYPQNLTTVNNIDESTLDYHEIGATRVNLFESFTSIFTPSPLKFILKKVHEPYSTTNFEGEKDQKEYFQKEVSQHLVVDNNDSLSSAQKNTSENSTVENIMNNRVTRFEEDETLEEYLQKEVPENITADNKVLAEPVQIKVSQNSMADNNANDSLTNLKAANIQEKSFPKNDSENSAADDKDSLESHQKKHLQDLTAVNNIEKSAMSYDEIGTRTNSFKTCDSSFTPSPLKFILTEINRPNSVTNFEKEKTENEYFLKEVTKHLSTDSNDSSTTSQKKVPKNSTAEQTIDELFIDFEEGGNKKKSSQKKGLKNSTADKDSSESLQKKYPQDLTAVNNIVESPMVYHQIGTRLNSFKTSKTKFTPSPLKFILTEINRPNSTSNLEGAKTQNEYFEGQVSESSFSDSNDSSDSSASFDQNASENLAVENITNDSTTDDEGGETPEVYLQKKVLENIITDYNDLSEPVQEKVPQNSMAENNVEDLLTNSVGVKNQEESFQKNASANSPTHHNDSLEYIEKKYPDNPSVQNMIGESTINFEGTKNQKESSQYKDSQNSTTVNNIEKSAMNCDKIGTRTILFETYGSSFTPSPLKFILLEIHRPNLATNFEKEKTENKYFLKEVTEHSFTDNNDSSATFQKKVPENSMTEQTIDELSIDFEKGRNQEESSLKKGLKNSTAVDKDSSESLQKKYPQDLTAVNNIFESSMIYHQIGTRLNSFKTSEISFTPSPLKFRLTEVHQPNSVSNLGGDKTEKEYFQKEVSQHLVVDNNDSLSSTQKNASENSTVENIMNNRVTRFEEDETLEEYLQKEVPENITADNKVLAEPVQIKVSQNSMADNNANDSLTNLKAANIQEKSFPKNDSENSAADDKESLESRQKKDLQDLTTVNNIEKSAMNYDEIGTRTNSFKTYDSSFTPSPLKFILTEIHRPNLVTNFEKEKTGNEYFLKEVTKHSTTDNNDSSATYQKKVPENSTDEQTFDELSIDFEENGNQEESSQKKRLKNSTADDKDSSESLQKKYPQDLTAVNNIVESSMDYHEIGTIFQKKVPENSTTELSIDEQSIDFKKVENQEESLQNEEPQNSTADINDLSTSFQKQDPQNLTAVNSIEKSLMDCHEIETRVDLFETYDNSFTPSPHKFIVTVAVPTNFEKAKSLKKSFHKDISEMSLYSDSISNATTISLPTNFLDNSSIENMMDNLTIDFDRSETQDKYFHKRASKNSTADNNDSLESLTKKSRRNSKVKNMIDGPATSVEEAETQQIFREKLQKYFLSFDSNNLPESFQKRTPENFIAENMIYQPIDLSTNLEGAKTQKESFRREVSENSSCDSDKSMIQVQEISSGNSSTEEITDDSSTDFEGSEFQEKPFQIKDSKNSADAVNNIDKSIVNCEKIETKVDALETYENSTLSPRKFLITEVAKIFDTDAPSSSPVKNYFEAIGDESQEREKPMDVDAEQELSDTDTSSTVIIISRRRGDESDEGSTDVVEERDLSKTDTNDNDEEYKPDLTTDNDSDTTYVYSESDLY